MANEPIYNPPPDNNAEGAAVGASMLIKTIVWSIVVLILLGVALWALHVYLGWF